jgi:hypothetical protein
MLPRTGDVLHITRAASVQFVEPLLFRVIRVHDWPTYWGWAWLDGYELNAAGEAVERRSIFVQVAGLRHAKVAPFQPRPRRPANVPAAVPDQQRARRAQQRNARPQPTHRTAGTASPEPPRRPLP